MILLNFKSYVTDYFKRIENEISELKKTIPVATVEIPKAVPLEIKEVKSKSGDEHQWESSFKIMEEPMAPTFEKEKVAEEKIEPESIKAKDTIGPLISEKRNLAPQYIPEKKPTFFEKNPDLEKFIGENLVSKIGIAILVLAIGFFVKFAIDNNWIGPVGRVGIGILCGGILVVLAHKLRNNYKAFSSVLVGGGLAVFYFTITLAYHQFHLFSQTAAFVIMIMITVFAVALSLLYDRQELAVIALVGGFAAPFLVSDGSGNYRVLFIYLIILNAGLLIIAYNKAWRLMNMLAFIFTVLLFGSWLFSISYDAPAEIYSNGIIFAAIFYLLFFFINIANNIKENKKFIASDFSILLINTGLFFAAGLYCLTEMKKPEYRGLFTTLIGVLNLIASYFLFRKRKVDTNVLYLLIGITLTFISLTAPIQLHGNNITLFWASESVLLFWLFEKSKINIIQYASLIVWFAMLVSLMIDWANIYADATIAVRIVANKAFITGFYSAIASYVLFILRNKMPEEENLIFDKIISKHTFRVAGVVLLFLTGALEINYQCRYYFPAFAMNILYLQLYSFAFVLSALFISEKIKSIKLSFPLQTTLLAACILFYLFCFGIITDLEDNLLKAKQFTGYFNACWIIAILIGFIFYKLIQIARKKDSFLLKKTESFVWLICTAIVMFLSFETFWAINKIYYDTQNPLAEIERVFIKTCLPILWGFCSFSFMWLGMKYKFKPLRIISLVLFLITLLKLFIFDISNIPVGGKIAAFFCLGVLLLVVSFMYQRLKKIIIHDEENRSV